MAHASSALPEIESFNMSELDVSGLDMRLELTTLMPRVVTPDCGPSYGCSCYSNCSNNCVCHSHNNYYCQCHSNNTCSCHSNICVCHTNCEVNA